MIVAAREHWTEQQILDALYGKSGVIRVAFRYDVLRNGARVRSVAAEGEVSLNRFANIQRTARFSFTEPLDWLNEEVKPYMLLRMEDEISILSKIIETWDQRDLLDFTFQQWDDLDLTWDELDDGILFEEEREPTWAEFPLGVFVLSTPQRSSENGSNTWDVEAYDHTIILEEDCIVAPLFIPKDTPYLEAIGTILIGAGITNVFMRDTVTTVLPSNRTFEIGTSKRSIINKLLSEINFDSIYCDADGNFIISAYTEPSASVVTGVYRDDYLSIIERDTQSEVDYYKTPNVFIAVCDNPDMEESYVSVWINDNPASMFSTIQRGRNITSDIYQPDAISSQAALDAYIKRYAIEVTNNRYEHLTFNTALNPLHERAEVLEIRHPDISGIFIESNWTLPLRYDGRMKHEARRLVVMA